ncbi:carboxylesterase family protein [Paracandidimonas soli]|uniref:carboxylesterase family protein n=1 Tax=Paracandidimonas soli TaxID=1917182 RepID=UPI003340F45A
MAEDCLYLSVWTPSTAGCCPVLVWMHGGATGKGQGASEAICGPRAPIFFAPKSSKKIILPYNISYVMTFWIDIHGCKQGARSCFGAARSCLQGV